MKCYICGNDKGTRKNMVLNHCAICESYVCVCDNCFKDVKEGKYRRYSYGNCPDMDTDGACLLSAPDICLHKDGETGDCCKDD